MSTKLIRVIQIETFLNLNITISKLSEKWMFIIKLHYNV